MRTPLILFDNVFAKLEGENPTGSIKYRFALHSIETAERQGKLRRGMTVIEASSGNTAIALAHVCREKGYGAEFLLPRSVSEEVVSRIESYGASAVVCNDDNPFSALDKVLEKSRTGNYFWTKQYFNESSHEAYAPLADELVSQIVSSKMGACIDTLVCCVGTGGTITGVSSALKHKYSAFCPALETVAVLAVAGSHIAGVRPFGLEVSYKEYKDLFSRSLVSSMVQIDETEARAGIKYLNRRGVSAGMSSGAVVRAASKITTRITKENGTKEKGNCVIILADGKFL